MRKLTAILVGLLLVGGCTMTEVSTDQEEMEKTESQSRKASTNKGIHIVITTTNS